MMINKRLLAIVPGSMVYIVANVACQWVAMLANAAFIFALGGLLAQLLAQPANAALAPFLAVAALALALRFCCLRGSARLRYLSSHQVKRSLRSLIYQKLLALGPAYRQQAPTAQIVQVAVEGVDQLETYFGAYLPQFFYSMLAPVTLFAILSFISLRCAVVLLICVPLIPVSIAVVQTFAKKLLAKYWGKYTQMGDSFLENLQGLTTLKIYQADAAKQQEMAVQAEEFRKVTMRVLSMQLNSIIIMDIIAYGGAALGTILALSELSAGRIAFSGCFALILLGAEFFLPMRQLGSYFHVAMNGMAATDQIFALLDLPEPETGAAIPAAEHCSIACQNVGFSYDGERQILQQLSLEIPQGALVAVVGESGSGKSTLAGLLAGQYRGYTGSIVLGGVELRDADPAQLMKACTYIGHQSHIFKGTVRETLTLAAPEATEAQLWAALEQVKLAGFLAGAQGLDTPILENAANLSGGQRQRLALARALLHNSPVYIFDEATSNIDVESENDIMAVIHSLAQRHTVLLISHRLENVRPAQCIYVMEGGRIVQQGAHAALLAAEGLYRRLWTQQQALAQYNGTQQEVAE